MKQSSDANVKPAISWTVVGLFCLFLLAGACTQAIDMREAKEPQDTSNVDQGATTNVQTQETEPLPAWEVCEPFALDFYDATRRHSRAGAKRSHSDIKSAVTLEYMREPVLIDQHEARWGKKYAESTSTLLEIAGEVEDMLDDMPHRCFEYAHQWDELRTATESPIFEECRERQALARESIPDIERWTYLNEVFDVMDKLLDKSSVVDADVAHEVIGELLYADYLLMQDAAKASLVSLCSATEWEQAAAQLSPLRPQKSE